jgi:hypothetical protein
MCSTTPTFDRWRASLQTSSLTTYQHGLFRQRAVTWGVDGGMYSPMQGNRNHSYVTISITIALPELLPQLERACLHGCLEARRNSIG